MIFLETSVFTRRVTEEMDDDSYQALQAMLAEHPDAGTVIRHSGGIRKLRWNGSGRGKRGGSRIIYYWDFGDRILMLFLYRKKEQADLSEEQLQTIRKIVKGYENERQ